MISIFHKEFTISIDDTLWSFWNWIWKSLHKNCKQTFAIEISLRTEICSQWWFWFVSNGIPGSKNIEKYRVKQKGYKGEGWSLHSLIITLCLFLRKICLHCSKKYKESEIHQYPRISLRVRANSNIVCDMNLKMLCFYFLFNAQFAPVMPNGYMLKEFVDVAVVAIWFAYLAIGTFLLQNPKQLVVTLNNVLHGCGKGQF